MQPVGRLGLPVITNEQLEDSCPDYSALMDGAREWAQAVATYGNKRNGEVFQVTFQNTSIVVVGGASAAEVFRAFERGSFEDPSSHGNQSGTGYSAGSVYEGQYGANVSR